MGSDPNNYAIEPHHPKPYIVGDGVKVSFSIADPQQKWIFWTYSCNEGQLVSTNIVTDIAINFWVLNFV